MHNTPSSGINENPVSWATKTTYLSPRTQAQPDILPIPFIRTRVKEKSRIGVKFKLLAGLLLNAKGSAPK
jgi:hypothetical protein